jgi:hypothetical protein
LIYLSTTLKLHGRYEPKNAKYRQRELLKKLILVAYIMRINDVLEEDSRKG